MRKLAALIVAICLALPSAGQSFQDRLRQGYEHLETGAVDDALRTFRELETDEPENDVVHYSIASTRYRAGMRDLEDGNVEDGLSAMNEAKRGFETLMASADPFVRRNAGYNAANSTAWIAKQAMHLGDHEQTVKAFEESIRAYEEVLRTQPDHDGARRNLEHMRYLLKQMLQNPPPPQDQQQQPGEDGEEQEQEGQEPQDQQDGEPDQDDMDDPSEDEGDPSDTPPPSASEGDTPEEPEELNMQNIEAILQSLEDQDREEQKRLRRSRVPPRIQGGKWW